MFPEKQSNIIDVLDVSHACYSERVSAVALQGLVNRVGARLFLDFGFYDDPLARRTNEVFMDDEIWFGKYRAMLGNQDQRNLEYYRKEHGYKTRQAASLIELIRNHANILHGCVVWDTDFPDTINLALMLAAQVWR